MRAELLAGLVNKIALREFFSGVFFYEGAVISVGDEAYILAVMLFCVYKAVFLGYFANLGFAVFPEWKQRAAELVLSQRIQNVALILAFVKRLF